MIKTYTTYSKTSGEILRTIMCDLDTLKLNLGGDEGYLEGQHNPDEFCVSDGHVVKKVRSEQEIREDLASKIKMRRDSLLNSSDWTQMPDSPVNKADWVKYRQALRDVPQQGGFPDNIVWPTQPS